MATDNLLGPQHHKLQHSLLGYNSHINNHVGGCTALAVISTMPRIHLQHTPVPPPVALLLTLSYNGVVPSCDLELDNICPLWCLLPAYGG